MILTSRVIGMPKHIQSTFHNFQKLIKCRLLCMCLAVPGICQFVFSGSILLGRVSCLQVSILPTTCTHPSCIHKNINPFVPYPSIQQLFVYHYVELLDMQHLSSSMHDFEFFSFANYFPSNLNVTQLLILSQIMRKQITIRSNFYQLAFLSYFKNNTKPFAYDKLFVD